MKYKLLPLLMLFARPLIASTDLSMEIASNSLTQKPFLFMENKGQVANLEGEVVQDIKYTAQSKGVKLFLSANGIHYQFKKNKEEIAQVVAIKKNEQPKSKTEFYRLDMELKGANPNPQIIAENKSEYYENYYLAHCPKQGITDVHGYSKLTYKNIYPGIDWVVYSKGNEMKYDFVVHPGADPQKIKISYPTAQTIDLAATGEVVVKTRLGELAEGMPYCWTGKEHIIVNSKFKLVDNILQFDLENYNTNEELIIDPTLQWAGYFGGNSTDKINKILPARNSGLYIIGSTYSTSGLAYNPNFNYDPYQLSAQGQRDGFYSKITSSGALEYSTYIGWGGNDEAISACLSEDNTGTVLVVVGNTEGSGAVSLYGFMYTFLDSYHSQGYKQGAKEFGFLLGGDNSTSINDVVPLSQFRVMVAGTTSSTTGMSAVNSPFGFNDAFVAMYDLDFAVGPINFTYLGGSGDDDVTSIAKYKNNSNFYLGGHSNSSSGISSSGIQQDFSNGGYILKLDSNFAQQWGRYTGGSEVKIACDSQDNVFTVGMTDQSSLIATSNAYQTVLGDMMDAFIMKFDNQGTKLWGSYFGTDEWYEESPNVVVDNGGNAIISTSGGVLTSGMVHAFQPLINGTGDSYGFWTVGGYNVTRDAVIGKFDPNGTIIWSSYYGGRQHEKCTAICLSDNNEDFYLGGNTLSNDLAYNTTNAVNDIFVAKLFNASVELDNFPYQGFCQGDSIDIPYETYDFVPAGASYSALLLLNKSTSSIITLGTDSTGSGVIHGYIPSTIPATFFGNFLKIVPSYTTPIVTIQKEMNNIFALPNVFINAVSSTNFCAGNGTLLQANANNVSNYQWKYNGTAITGANSSSYFATLNGYYEVEITNTNSCTAKSNPLFLTVYPKPPAHVTADNDTIICSNESVTLKTPLSPIIALRQWEFSTNGLTWNSIAGANGINYVTSIGGYYRCLCTSASGCDSTSNSINVVVNAAPTASISPNGTQAVCAGSSISLQANTGSGYSYQWSLNMLPLVGETSGSLAASQAGNYQVEVTNSFQCATLSLPVNVIVYTKPSAHINPASSTSICQGSFVTLTANNAAGVSRQWLFNGNDIPNETAISYQASNTGNYQVRVTNLNGCDSISNVIAVIVYPYPSASISYTGIPYTCGGNVLQLHVNTGNGYSYQWRLDGIAISNATYSLYTVVLPDSALHYSVTVTNAGICAVTSPETIINPIPSPIDMCIVSVDSLSKYNVITWEKSPSNLIDSFRIYREYSTNLYAYVASVGYPELSQYIDTNLANSNPNQNSERYKISVLDICGNESAKSSYHHTILLQDQQNGNFDWNKYEIENQFTPVTNYFLYRDTGSTGNWGLPIANTTGNVTQISIPDYAQYPNASYKVETNYGFNCVPSQRTSTGINNTRSNIKNRIAIGIHEPSVNQQIILMPNPARGEVILKCERSIVELTVYDCLGKLALKPSSDVLKNTSIHLNISSLAPGVYTLLCKGKDFTFRKKLVVE
ncbi:MAG: T9SS type A sorting domain-containing protein [Bacteroidetes bacterium]|nr:T9SS type A sorting domain-containing protein [Bacteroidota bacterium]